MASNAGEQSSQDRSAAQLISDASEQLSRLVRDEMRLAVAEVQQKGKRVGVGVGLFGAAGAVAFYGGAALVTCAVLALSLVLAPWLAALIVGVAVLGVAGVLALLGKKQVQRGIPPVPEQTVSSVKTDIQTVKEGFQR